MKRQLSFFLLLLCCVSVSAAPKKLPYQDKNLSVDARVSDLISRMTLEEKIGQLCCAMAWNYYTIDGRKSVRPSESFKKDVRDFNVGMLWATYRADPWTQKTLADGLNPELAAKAGNALQKYVIENTRLGIPLFLAEEAPHGHMAIGTTVFPTGIGMAATFSPELIEETGRVIAKEIRLQGAHISYGPVLDLARDPRWSRVEETMGEDPVLTAIIGSAMVKGLGGGNISQPYATLATLKHFIAYGTTEGGQNGNQTMIGQRELFSNFLPPFKRVIDAGALSVMTSYNSLDGIPSTMNDFLLKDVLRKQWNFRGFVVSDLFSIDGIYGTHGVAKDLQEAAAYSLNAGVDVDLGATAFRTLSDAVKQGQVAESAIDEACANVLRLKFEMGLFDNPYVEPKLTKDVRSAEHIDVAHRVDQASITLLENKQNILPLKKNTKVAVIGPNADNRYNMLGDYTAPQEDSNIITILDGVRQKVGADNVIYAKGCAVRDSNQVDIEAAVRAARQADVVIVAVGGSSARDFKTSYKETGAAITDESAGLSDMDCGEGFDRATLGLLGKQNELLDALHQVGKPMIVVYIEGRPLLKNWAHENADALIDAYYPGQQGGLAIADVIFGDYNPSGRLPYSIPIHEGQLPVYYNKKAPAPHKYVEMSAMPLYSFGYGLSFTSFKYSNLQVSGNGKGATVSFDITNTGGYDGDEVAQLYLRDEQASTVQPVMQLKNFARVYIKKGETKHVSLSLSEEDLQVIDRNMQPVVEPGTFKVMVGAASNDIRLEGTLTVSQ